MKKHLMLRYGLSAAGVILSGFAAYDLTNLNGPVSLVDIEYIQTITPSSTDSVGIKEKVILYPNNSDLYIISREPKSVSVDSLHYYINDNEYNYQDDSVFSRMFLIVFGLIMTAWFLYENRTKTEVKEK